MPRSPPARLLALALLLTALPLAGCARPRAQTPPPETLAQVPDGYGRAYDGGALLTVKERQLVLPGDVACRASRRIDAVTSGAPACDAAVVAKLRRERKVLELDRTIAMGELSEPFAELAALLDDGEYACLLVRDARERRCVPFRPFGAGDFSAWIDAPRPLGKIRVIFRADGMEVVADRGKVPGPDRFGPSLPPRDGRPDFAGLDRLLRLMAQRFSDEDQAALAPSAGLRIEQVARALSMLNGRDGERFEKTLLVYP